MKGVSAEQFVDEHLEDRTIDDVLGTLYCTSIQFRSITLLDSPFCVINLTPDDEEEKQEVVDAIASATVAYAAKKKSKKTKKKKEIEGGDEENEPVKKAKKAAPTKKEATSKAAAKKEVEVVDLVEVSPEAPSSPGIHPYYLV